VHRCRTSPERTPPKKCVIIHSSLFFLPPFRLQPTDGVELLSLLTLPLALAPRALARPPGASTSCVAALSLPPLYPFLSLLKPTDGAELLRTRSAACPCSAARVSGCGQTKRYFPVKRSSANRADHPLTQTTYSLVTRCEVRAELSEACNSCGGARARSSLHATARFSRAQSSSGGRSVARGGARHARVPRRFAAAGWLGEAGQESRRQGDIQGMHFRCFRRTLQSVSCGCFKSRSRCFNVADVDSPTTTFDSRCCKC
jgi:hypothetical protein